MNRIYKNYDHKKQKKIIKERIEYKLWRSIENVKVS